MHVDGPLLLDEVVESLRRLEENVSVLIVVVVQDRVPDVIPDSFALVPHLELVLVQASLPHLGLTLETEHCVDPSLAEHLVHVNLIEWIWAQNDVMECSSFV